MYYNNMSIRKRTKRDVHIVISDIDLFNKLKGKIYTRGETVQQWFEEQMRKEVYGSLND